MAQVDLAITTGEPDALAPNVQFTVIVPLV